MTIINELPSYILYVIGGIFSLLLLFIRGYIQEKGKLKALQSVNKQLVEETEKIKSNYSRELEELKKEHELDILKRKYQYESKKEHYFKYFQFLDQLAKENNVRNQEKLMAILEEFNRNYLNASYQHNKKNEANAITVMSKKVQKLSLDASQDLIRVKQETSTIRLIASDEVIDKLDLLQLAYDRCFEDSNKMMKNLASLILSDNQLQMQKDQKEIEISGMVINKIIQELIVLMRKELNSI